MKLGVIFLSIAAMACSWWWLTRRHEAVRPRTFAARLKIAGQSVLAGVIVYFCLMLFVLMYLMVTTP